MDQVRANFEHRLKMYAYEAAVELAAHSRVPSIAAAAQAKAERLARELGLI